MSLKMIFPIIVGFVFALFILPRFANLTLAAKYKRGGVAFADERSKDEAITSCTAYESATATITESVQKMRCRTRSDAN